MTTTVPEVRPYSFGQSSHLTSEKSALYREAAVQIATDLSTALADTIAGFVVEAGPLIEVEAGEELVEDPDAFDQGSVRSGGGLVGVVVTELKLALTLVTALMGGAGISPGDPRRLTTIERRVLDLLGQVFVDAAKDTLLIDDDIAVDRSRDGAFTAADDDDTASRIGFSFGVRGPAGGGRLILAFDLSTLQSFSDAIDARLSGRRRAAAISTDPATAAALEPVPFPFSVGLGHVELTARQLVELEIGDVIRTGLAVDADLTAAVGDVEMFAVRLGQQGTTLVAHIAAARNDSDPNSTTIGPGGPAQQARTAIQ